LGVPNFGVWDNVISPVRILGQ